MTRRDKVILFCAVLLAGLVAATALVYWIGADRNEAGPILLFCFSVVLGAGSVWVVHRTLIRARRGEALLDPDFRAAYQTVRDAAASSPLGVRTRGEVLDDVLDLMLSSQRDGRHAAEAIGNPVTFASEILRVYLRPGRRWLLDALDGLVAWGLMVLGSGLLLWIEDAERPIDQVRLDGFLLVFFTVVAFNLLPLTRRLIAAGNPWAYILPVAGGVGMVLVAELARKFLYALPMVRTMLDGEVRVFPGAAVPFVILVIVIGLFIAKLQLRRRPVRKLHSRG